MKNFDFYIGTIEDVSVHFSYEGEMQIHSEGPVHYKDIERAIVGYKAMKAIIDITDTKQNDKTYDVYFEDKLLEAGLPTREEAELLIDDWIASCEGATPGADYLNYRIECVKSS